MDDNLVNDANVSRRKIRLKCKICAHEWIPRTGNPQRCPKCRSSRWDSDFVKKNTCNLCGHRWKSSGKIPHKCPNCHSARWNHREIDLKCHKCGYSWMKKGPRLPARCPECRSENWSQSLQPNSIVFVEPNHYLDCFIRRHMRSADIFRVLSEDIDEDEKVRKVMDILDVGEEELRVYLRYLEGSDLVSLSISCGIPFQSALNIIQDTTSKIYCSYGPGAKA